MEDDRENYIKYDLGEILEDISKDRVLEEKFREVLEELSVNERKIIYERYGLGSDGTVKTVDEVARELGITREKIRQVESRVLVQMQNIIYGKKLNINGLHESPLEEESEPTKSGEQQQLEEDEIQDLKKGSQGKDNEIDNIIEQISVERQRFRDSMKQIGGFRGEMNHRDSGTSTRGIGEER